MSDIKWLRLHGRTYSKLGQELLVRVESLEHLSNQHDILLNAVLDMLEKDMAESIDTKSTI